MQAAAFVAIGYGVRNAGICKDKEIQAASRFGSAVLAPAMALQSFLRLPSLHSAWVLVMGATAIAVLLSVAVMWVTTPKRHPAQRALLLGCSVGGLVSTIALPLLSMLFGSAAVQIAAVTGLVTATSVLAGSYLLCSTSQSGYPKNYRHEDGGVYNGQWQGKNKQGLGSYLYPGGAKYEGEWRNNSKEGRGVYTFPKGGSYEGEWQGGEREGVGIRTMRSGKVLAGRWQQGQLAVPMEEWQCALAAETAHHAARAAKRVPVGQGELGVALQQVLISPVVLATLAGMLLTVLQLSPPPTVVTLTGILAVPFAPLMLIVHGASLQTKGIPASQWQDVCQVTAARYVPALLLLAGALSCVALPGAALPLVSPGAAAVVMAACVALISPVPIEVSQYAQRFNLRTAGLGLDSNVHKGPEKQGSRQADGDSASGTADGAMEGPVEGPVERPVEEPSEDVISDPATLPDESQASGNGDDVNVGTPGFGDSDVGNDNVRKGPDQHGGSHDDKYSSAKYNEESQIAESEAQSPAEGSGRVANRSLESSKKAAAEFGIGKAAASWSEIIEDPEVDAVVIGTWPYLHHTLVLAALAANKHALTEARLAMNAQEAREMLKASQQKPNLVTQVVPSPITFTWDATIQGIIQEGKLGDLIYVEVRGQSGTFPQATGSTMTWRQDVDLSGLNVMKLGIFYEALQRWVGDATKVQALAKTVVKTRTHGETGEPAHVQIPDHLDVLAELACGAQAHIVISDVTGVGRTTQNEIWLYGSKGTLHLDLDAKKLSIALQEAGGKLQEVKVSAEKEGAWRVEEEFIGAIRGSEQIQRTSFATGVRYMEFTQAVAASSQTGQAVYLPLTH
ncbi:hypothetical protein WJX82_010955 [Trebouxia sp. C0006]